MGGKGGKGDGGRCGGGNRDRIEVEERGMGSGDNIEI